VASILIDRTQERFGLWPERVALVSRLRGPVINQSARPGSRFAHDAPLEGAGFDRLHRSRRTRLPALRSDWRPCLRSSRCREAGTRRIKERTVRGRADAKAKGGAFGRKPNLTPHHEFAADSALEGTGFEPSVPEQDDRRYSPRPNQDRPPCISACRPASILMRSCVFQDQWGEPYPWV
jgi:hypothetical protein